MKSWQQDNGKTIVNCFQKGGFVKSLPEDSRLSQDPGVDWNEEDDTLTLPKVVNGAESLNTDNDAPYFPEDNHLEDYIIEAIVNKRSCADRNDDLDDNSDQEQTGEPTVTHTAARCVVQVLERYFMEQRFSETFIAALDTCSNAVRRKASASTLDRFFSWMNCTLLHVFVALCRAAFYLPV